MIPRLHAVTDDRVLAREGFVRRARAVLRAGGSRLALHVRGPGSTGARIFEVADALRDEARERGSLLLANDRVDVALALGLPGAHLGARSLPPDQARRILGPGSVLGASVHSVDEARDAERGGADFVLAGTVFPSPSHPDRPPSGAALLERMREACGLPVVAIGGVTPERVGSALKAGAHGVAAVSGIWEASDPAGAVASFLQATAKSAVDGSAVKVRRTGGEDGGGEE